MSSLHPSELNGFSEFNGITLNDGDYTEAPSVPS